MRNKFGKMSVYALNPQKISSSINNILTGLLLEPFKYVHKQDKNMLCYLNRASTVTCQ